MTGGISSLEVHRPARIPVRLVVEGSIGSLNLDGKAVGTMGGQLRRETEGWARAEDRLDLVVGGGIGHLDLTADVDG
jgi:hypothetical protein